MRFILLLAFLTPSLEAFAFHRPMGWRGGRWVSGSHGWWWVVGPRGYAYDVPYYPYPAYSESQTLIEISRKPPEELFQGASESVTGSPPQSPDPKKSFAYYCEAQKLYYPAAQTCEPHWKATEVTEPSAYLRYCPREDEVYPRLDHCEQGWVVVPSVDRWTLFAGSRSKEAVLDRPYALTLEFLGRALVYSINFDWAITPKVTVGLGLSHWAYHTWSWWYGDQYHGRVSAIPLYVQGYFNEAPTRGYLTAGVDFISATASGWNTDTFANTGVALTVGGGYEARTNQGFIFRLSGVVIIGHSVSLNPGLSLGFTF